LQGRDLARNLFTSGLKRTNKPYVRIAHEPGGCHDQRVPRVSADQLEARRQQILAGARACFARHGYEGATVRRLEEEIRLSRGAIFHHFRDKESLFLAVAEDDAVAMVDTVARNGLVQVMRDLLDRAAPPVGADGADGEPEVAGWLGTQLEVSRRLRTDPEFASRWAARTDAIAAATRERLSRQRDAGVLRSDVDLAVLAQFLELAYDGLVLHLATGRPTADLGRVLDLVEAAVRR
jgi:TetR/AcrR family transcriptional regulator, transcriptional repressor of aconitase